MSDAMNGTMKAISQDELGGPDVLKLVSLPTPKPGVSEILIRVHAAGVNPIDGANRETGGGTGVKSTRGEGIEVPQGPGKEQPASTFSDPARTVPARAPAGPTGVATGVRCAWTAGSSGITRRMR